MILNKIKIIANLLFLGTLLGGLSEFLKSDYKLIPLGLSFFFFQFQICESVFGNIFQFETEICA